MKNSTYDKAKFVAQIALPAAGTLYFAIAGIWHLPAADEVVGTVVAVDAFLGALLGISSANYNPEDDHVGSFNVIHNEDGTKAFSLDLNGDPNELISKKTITFKLDHSQGQPEEH